MDGDVGRCFSFVFEATPPGLRLHGACRGSTDMSRYGGMHKSVSGVERGRAMQDRQTMGGKEGVTWKQVWGCTWSDIKITAPQACSALRHWRLSPKIKAPAYLACRWLSAHFVQG